MLWWKHRRRRPSNLVAVAGGLLACVGPARGEDGGEAVIAVLLVFLFGTCVVGGLAARHLLRKIHSQREKTRQQQLLQKESREEEQRQRARAAANARRAKPKAFKTLAIKPLDADEGQRVENAMLNICTPGIPVIDKKEPYWLPRGSGAWATTDSARAQQDLSLLMADTQRLWEMKDGDIIDELVQNLPFADSPHPHVLLREVCDRIWKLHGKDHPTKSPLMLLILLLFTQEFPDTDRLLLYDAPVWIEGSTPGIEGWKAYLTERRSETPSEQNPFAPAQGAMGSSVREEIDQAAMSALSAKASLLAASSAFSEYQKWIKTTVAVSHMAAQPAISAPDEAEPYQALLDPSRRESNTSRGTEDFGTADRGAKVYYKTGVNIPHPVISQLHHAGCIPLGKKSLLAQRLTEHSGRKGSDSSSSTSAQDEGDPPPPTDKPRPASPPLSPVHVEDPRDGFVNHEDGMSDIDETPPPPPPIRVVAWASPLLCSTRRDIMPLHRIRGNTTSKRAENTVYLTITVPQVPHLSFLEPGDDSPTPCLVDVTKLSQYGDEQAFIFPAFSVLTIDKITLQPGLGTFVDLRFAGVLAPATQCTFSRDVFNELWAAEAKLSRVHALLDTLLLTHEIPQCLYVSGVSEHVDGTYALLDRKGRGMPIWEKRSSCFYVFTSASTKRWVIGRDVEGGTGLVVSEGHNGAMPHIMQTWLRGANSKYQEAWILDGAITVTAVRRPTDTHHVYFGKEKNDEFFGQQRQPSFAVPQSLVSAGAEYRTSGRAYQDRHSVKNVFSPASLASEGFTLGSASDDFGHFSRASTDTPRNNNINSRGLATPLLLESRSDGTASPTASLPLNLDYEPPPSQYTHLPPPGPGARAQLLILEGTWQTPSGITAIVDTASMTVTFRSPRWKEATAALAVGGQGVMLGDVCIKSATTTTVVWTDGEVWYKAPPVRSESAFFSSHRRDLSPPRR